MKYYILSVDEFKKSLVDVAELTAQVVVGEVPELADLLIEAVPLSPQLEVLEDQPVFGVLLLGLCGLVLQLLGFDLLDTGVLNYRTCTRSSLFYLRFSLTASNLASFLALIPSLIVFR